MSDFDTKLLKYRLLGKVSEIKAQGGECILVTLDDGTKPPYEASYEVYIGDNVKDCSYDLNKFFKQLAGRPHIKIIGGKNIKSLDSMFMSVKQDKLDLSNFDTHKVITMEQMFEEAEIKNLDVSSFDVSNVTDFKQMFHEFKTEELNLSSFKIRKDKEVSTYAMFQYSGIEELITSDERIISAAEEYSEGWSTRICKITSKGCF